MSCSKRRVKFILNNKVKYYTKEMIRCMNLIAIALFIVMTIIFIKFKPVCIVSSNGEKLGYITNKNDFEAKVKELIDNNQTENVVAIDTVTVSYEFAFVNKDEEINESEIIAKIQDNTKITYKYYAVTVDNKQKSIVSNLAEAEKLVTEIKKAYADVTSEVGINEIYTQNKNEYKTVNAQVAKKEISNELEEKKSASVNGIYLAQKPITGVITSRFGSRESIRTHAHTGLDIAAPYGTKIKAAADGTVTWSGYKGSYGNLVIVNCGNDVEIYYGHCSKLLVKSGEKVKAGDVIAEVGSTGNSTGNHLHFEIRIDGTSVNPQKYIYK